MFKKNSALQKTLIGSFIVVLLITVVTVTGDYSSGYSGFGFSNAAFYFGLAALGVGLAALPIAIIFYIAGKPEYGKAFLLTCGILLLLSGISCSSAAFLS